MDQDKETTTPENQPRATEQPPQKKRAPVIEDGGEYRIRDKYHKYRLATQGRHKPY